MKKFYFLFLGLLLSTLVFGQYLNESFENAWSGTPAAPGGWSQIAGVAGTGSGSNLSWEQSVFAGSWTPAGNGTAPTSANSGAAVAHYNDFNAQTGQTDTLKTGTIDLSVSIQPRVSFYYFYNTGTAKLKVLASADGVTNWTDLTAGGIAATGANWIKYSFDLSAYKTSTCKLAFVVVAAYSSHDLWLDNIIVNETPSPMSGTFTIDNTIATGGMNFASFSDAVNALNDAGVSGPVLFNVMSGQVFTEEVPVITATGTIANTITFNKFGTGNNPVIKSAGAAGTEGGIAIKGGDYFTFNGIDITISTGNALEYGYYINNGSATNGAQYNTIKNCKITLNRTNTASRGIFQYYGTAAATNASGTNSNNLYENIVIENSYQGIYLNGTSATYPDENSIIRNCTIGAATANDIGGGSVACYGLRISFGLNITISSNTVRNVYTSSATVGGIFAEATKGANNLIEKNTVYDIKTTSTTTTNYVYGIRSDGNAATETLTTSNNMIFNLSHGATTPSGTAISIRSLALNVGGGGTHFVYYNTVYINGGGIAGSTALYVVGTATHTIKNNIFYNSSPGGATSKRYCIYRSSGTLVSNNNNLIITSGTNNFTGFYTSDFATLANWQAATGTPDLASISVDPMFVSSTDLHFRNKAMNALGTPIVGITTDIDGDNRNGANPDMGADEYEDTTMPTATYNPVYGSANIAVSTNVDVVYSEDIRKPDNTVIDNTNVASLITFTDGALNNVPFTATWNAAAKTISIVPSSALSSLTQYNVNVASVEDTWDNADGGSGTQFTTGAADLTAPLIDSAVVVTATPNVVKVYFNENVKLTSTSGITIKVNTIAATINSFSGSNSQILIFTLSANVLPHDVVTFSYTQSSGDITDIVGNSLADVTDLPVVNNLKSSAKDITSFSILSPVSTGIISGNNIVLPMAVGTDVTALIANIVISGYASVSPASGSTVNFTSPVNFTVTAEDGTTKIYSVSVVYYYNAPYNQDFVSYPPADWFEATGNIPTPTAGSSSWSASAGFANTGTNPAFEMNIYNNDNDWLVSPIINLGTGGYWLKHNVAATAWNAVSPVTMSSEDTVFVLVSTDAGLTWSRTNKATQYTVSNSPGNTGSIEKFNTSLYTGMVRFAYYAKGTGSVPDMDIHFDDFSVFIPSSEKDILSFAFTSPAATGTINGTEILITVPANTDITNLTPQISISSLATINPAAGAAQDFSTPFNYTVTAEDGTTKIYTVYVVVASPTVAVLPADASTGIPTNASITFTYSAPVRMEDNTIIDDSNVASLLTLKTPDINGSNVPFTATISLDKKVITITPNSILGIGTTYFASVVALEGYYDNSVAGISTSFETTLLIGWCNLSTQSVTASNTSNTPNVFAQVFTDGITNSPGQGLNIGAWFGYSATNTNPETWTNWVPAVYNGDVGSNDEYKANLGLGFSEGTYYFASRFQLGNGVYSYGGYNVGGEGIWDGINNVSGVLTVQDNIAPVVISASVENAAPAELRVNFSENVSITDATGFTVFVQNIPVNVLSVSGSGTQTIIFTLESNVLSHQYVKFGYDATGNVKDVSSNQNPLAQFTTLDHIVVNNVKSSEKVMLTFGFSTPSVQGVFNGNNINIYLPVGTDVTNLVAEFTVSDYATVNISGTEQISGGTVNNFTNPKVYSVVAEDGTVNNYDVLVIFYTNIPYVQNFNASTSLPQGWTGTMTISGTHGVSSNGLYRNLYNSVTTANAFAPVVGIANNFSRLQFDYRITNYTGFPNVATTLGNNDKIEVQVSTNNGISYNTVYTINNSNHQPSTVFSTKTIDLSSFAGSALKVKFLCTWGEGDYYVDIDNFSIYNIVVPTVSTIAATNIVMTSAVSGGDITNSGGGIVSARGVCWSTSQNPDIIGNHTTDGTGIGTFASNITGLTGNTVYYYRAYATNEAGTSYGNELSFTTLNLDAPSVTTSAALNITINSAAAGGTITSDGGDASISESGILYSTIANPQYGGANVNKVVSNPLVTSGLFATDMTSLSPATTYYFRAFAVNNTGIGYGEVLSFVTLDIPNVVTNAVSNITTNSASFNGDVTSDGGSGITLRGFCWGVNAMPDTNGTHIYSTGTNGQYSELITGLNHSTLYHVRAFAVNEYGIKYGNDVTFATSCGSVSTFPWLENFENVIFPPTCWTLDNPNAGSKTWTRVVAASNATASVNCYSYSNVGHIDNLITPVIDITSLTNPVFEFRVAHRQYNTTDIDTLKVFVSTDGGQTFNAAPIYNKFGASLTTVPMSTTSFTPASNADWRKEILNIAQYSGNNVVFKFQVVNGYGNNIFIDDVKIYNAPTAVLSGDQSVCSGQEATLHLEFTGTSPWTVIATDGTETDTISFTDNSVDINVMVNSTVTVNLISVVDANGPGSVSGSAILTLVGSPVLTVANPQAVCSPSTIDLATTVVSNTNNGTLTYWADNAASVAISNPEAINASAQYFIKSMNSCGSDLDSVIVTINPAPYAYISALTPGVICEGDSATLEVILTGAAPWSYIGNDGTGNITFTSAADHDTLVVTPTTETTYSLVSVTDGNGCTSTVVGDLTISVNSYPVVNLGADVIICQDNQETVTLDAGNPGMAYLWSNNETTQTITVNSADLTLGSHSFSVTVSNSTCSSIDTISVTADICNKIAVQSFEKIELYPNPAKGIVRIKGAENTVIMIYNVLGEKIITKRISTSDAFLDIETLSPGSYMVLVTEVNGSIYKRTLIVE